MAKLHELLAVEGTLANQSNATRSDLISTFEKKEHHFKKILKTFKPNGENSQPVTEEQSDIQTSVKDEIKWISDKIAKALDVSYQIEVANTTARANVVLENGVTLLNDVPAQALLQLEKQLAAVLALVKAIKTLDPAKGFEIDPGMGNGTFKARDVNKNRTRKVQKALILYPATEKHPAQTQLITEDEVVGTILEQEWSTLITVKTKGDILDRVEDIVRAVRRARSKANDTDVDVKSITVGRQLLNYVFEPLQ